tara:strand:+ start:54 stop:524 length:471 start_codon:yes stop_codon:yes gene_type:complete
MPETLVIDIQLEFDRQGKFIEQFQDQLENVQFTRFSTRYHINDEVWEEDYNNIIKKCDIRENDLNSQILHSEYVIKLFKAMFDGNFRKMRVIENLMKANALDMEHYLQQCVEEDLCPEQWYLDRVNKLMAEQKNLNKFIGVIERKYNLGMCEIIET